jgi:hypothetical protein
VQKGRTLSTFLNSRGMNQAGWRISSSIQVVKSFIRPTLEYGIALNPPDSICDELGVVVNLALRLALSCRWRVSADAIRRCTGLESMRIRRDELCARFLKKIETASSPAGKVFRYVFSCTEYFGASIVKDLDKNVFFTDYSEDEERCFNVKQQLMEKETAMNEGSVAKAVGLRIDSGGYLVALDASLDREVQSAILQWQVGEFTFHQPCSKCGLELSRVHGVECAGIMNDLMVGLHTEYEQWSKLVGKTEKEEIFINYILNDLIRGKLKSKRRQEIEDRKKKIKIAYQAIAKIRYDCAGYRKNEFGTWRQVIKLNYKSSSNVTARQRKLAQALKKSTTIGRPRAIPRDRNRPP